MPEHMLLGRLARILLRSSGEGSGPIRVGSLEARRDYLDVDEAARLIIELAYLRQRPPPLINIASGCAVTMRVIVEAMMRRAGGIGRLVEDPTAFQAGPASVAGDTGLLRALGLEVAVPTPQSLAERILAVEPSS
jgi:nucleoside-diphosphate-sugar epimerase